MSTSPENDWLDELLTAEEPAYIDDNGFSAQVVQALPARRNASWLRPLILTVASLVAVFLGSMALPQGQDVSHWIRVAMNSMFASPALAVAMLAALGLSFLSASVVWVLQEK